MRSKPNVLFFAVVQTKIYPEDCTGRILEKNNKPSPTYSGKDPAPLRTSHTPFTTKRKLTLEFEFYIKFSIENRSDSE